MNQFNASELATILAALRYWQAYGQQDAGPADSFIDIATDGGTLRMLDAADIDDLCERLNCTEEPDDPAWDVESSQEEHERNNAAADAADRAADRAELASLGAWGIQR